MRGFANLRVCKFETVYLIIAKFGPMVGGYESNLIRISAKKTVTRRKFTDNYEAKITFR